MYIKDLEVICRILVILVVFTRACDSASINDTNVLLKDMLTNYNKNVRPLLNQDDAVNVSAILFIKSLQELDEIQGIFTIFGAVSMSWHDAKMTWAPEIYGGIEYVLTSYKDVWVPELIQATPAEDTNTLGKKWQRVTFHHNGFASWVPGNLIKSTCALDMNKYPFDTQVCTVSYLAWGYSGDQVKITASSDQIDLSFYVGNSAWKIAKTKTDIIYEGTQIEFHFFLERKPGLVIVNIILPLTILSMLNVFVFLLIPESGERIGYCITVLLSTAVFMTIVSDTLPSSSEPVPMISYKLLFDMLISSLITVTTILNLRLYNKEDAANVPVWLQRMYMFLSCRRAKTKVQPLGRGCVEAPWKRTDEQSHVSIMFKGSKRNAASSTTDVGGVPGARKSSIAVKNYEEIRNDTIKEKLVKMIPTTVNEDCEIEVSWKQISYMVDCLALVGFTLLSVGSCVVFMIITHNN